MARASAVTPEALQALGAEKLASLILDEIAGNPAFKRRVTAALTSETDPARPADMPPHADCLAALRRDHGRKGGFWTLVEGKVT